MAQTLKGFLISMAMDPTLMKAYQADPGDTVAKAGLSPDDSAALLSRSPEAIRNSLNASADDAGITVVVVITP
jgi:hypothetical protein